MADRGYESFNIFAHLILKGMYFVIRMKKINSNGILSAYDLPDSEFDTHIRTTLTRRHTKETLGNPNTYTILQPSTDFDWFFCTRRSRFASRRLLQVWVSSQVLIERPGYSVRLSLSVPDAPERPLVVVTSHQSASLKRGLCSRPPVRRLRFGGIRDSGTGEIPGLNPGNRLLPVVGGFSPSRLPDGLRRP